MDPAYHRQALMFGDAGQDILRNCKVGIIGLGGAGSLLAEYLGRLGVGRFILIDPDRIEITNLPRIVAATRLDALARLAEEKRPQWLQRIARRFARTKVALARRNILRANPEATVEAFCADFLEAPIAGKLLDCDYLFLAADTMRARLLFNSIVHQYLIPGIQVGAKVRVSKETGEIIDVYSVARPINSESGCLWCNGLINPAKLQLEGMPEHERRAQAYIDNVEVHAPSVITLNAIATSIAANDFLFYMTGLKATNTDSKYLRFNARSSQLWQEEPRADSGCSECGHGSKSRLARGDSFRLPTIE
jgi:molybdopterin/thiamine biosynthesis adenylyltransferase